MLVFVQGNNGALAFMQAFQILETFALIFVLWYPSYLFISMWRFSYKQISANAPSLSHSLSLSLPSFLPPSLHEQNFQRKQNANPPQSNNNPSGGGDYFLNHWNFAKKLFVLQIVVHKIVTIKNRNPHK